MTRIRCYVYVMRKNEMMKYDKYEERKEDE
jgi:hypothetical protein